MLLLWSIVAQAQWQKINNFTKGSVNCLSHSGSMLVAGTDSGGTFLSANSGNSWTQSNTGLANAGVYALAVSGGTILAGTEAGIFISADQGSNWSASNTGIGNVSVYSIITHGTDLIAGTKNGIYISTNHGDGWSENNSGLGNTYIHALVSDGSNLFAGTEQGIYISTNNGSTWTAANNGLTHDSVQSLTMQGNDIYAGTLGGGVFRSSNNGGSWTEVNTGLTNMNMWSLQTTGTCIIAGGGGGGKGNGTGGGTGGGKGKGGVFLSANHGANWVAINTGLTKNDVRSLAIHNGNIYAGTADGDVWKRSLSEVTTGIDNPERLREASFYPNPTQGKLTLRNKEEIQSISVYNLLGELIYNAQNIRNQFIGEIDLSQVKKGVYIIMLQQAEEQHTEKILIY
jgi:ligand-binding sensor domain-containing protein